jgi:hypothetical protein
MAFLDFMKNRTQAQQPVSQTAQTQKPETAKPMYAQEEVNDKATRPRVERMSKDQLSKAQEIGARFEAATKHLNQNVPSPPAGPADGATSPEPSRQNMMNQDKTAPALSPTSMQAGKTAPEKPAEKTPEKGRPDTLPRPKPSWER